MEKPGHEVGVLVERLASLWVQVWEQTTSAKLASTLSGLNVAYRQLVAIDAKLPATKSAGRCRRRNLEALQSATTELEAELIKVSKAAADLNACANRQLTVVLDALVDAPPVAHLDGSPDAPLLVSLGLIIAVPFCWRGQGLEVTACALVVIAALLRSYERFEFDGRSLTITRRVLDFTLPGSRVTDLAHFNKVRAKFHQVEVGNQGKTQTWRRLSVVSLDDVVVVADQSAGEELEALERYLVRWCAIAVRDTLRAA